MEKVTELNYKLLVEGMENVIAVIFQLLKESMDKVTELNI